MSDGTRERSIITEVGVNGIIVVGNLGVWLVCGWSDEGGERDDVF